MSLSEASSASQDANTFRRSDIWFEDGNIILQVEQVQFCIHRGVLARHSTVFKDMFSVPQPADSDAIDGCQVVRLEDSAKDWEELLGYIYDGVKKQPPEDSFDSGLVAAMLRLGHKYGFDAWKKKGLDLFTNVFPDQEPLFFQASWPSLRMGVRVLTLGPDDSFCDLVNLAFELCLRKRLPSIFLIAVAFPDWPAVLFTGTTSSSGKNSRLRPEVVPFLVKGRERVHQAMLTHLFSWQLLPRQCGIQRCQGVCISMYASEAGNPSRISTCRQHWHEVPRVQQLCGTCQKVGQSAFELGRTKFWEELPTYFGLPGWDKLKDFDFEL